MALNNCVLSNTTIFAESPAESEVQMILQHLGSGGGGAWRGGAAKVPSQLTFILQRLIGIECLENGKKMDSWKPVFSLLYYVLSGGIVTPCFA